MATRKCATQVPGCTGPDWSLLHSELIQLVSEKIIFKEQYDNMCLVCQEWKNACPPNPRHLIGQVPWLQLPRDPTSSALSYYDFLHSKTHNLDLPQFDDTRISHSRGWFLLEKDSQFSLFNPLTGETKSNCLPSLNTPPIILDFARDKNMEELSHFEEFSSDEEFDSYEGFSPSIGRFILTSSPSDEGCIVVAQLFPYGLAWDLGFCRIGDKSWTILQLSDTSGGIRDFKYKNGLVYAMGQNRQVMVFDLQKLSKKILIGNLCDACACDTLYLVLGEGELDGMPFIVRRAHRTPKDELHVYMCAQERTQSRWIRATNIGNSVMLLSDLECQIVPEFNVCEANHIYDCSEKIAGYSSIGGIKMQMVSIENGSIKETLASLGVSAFGGCTSFFTPSLC